MHILAAFEKHVGSPAIFPTEHEGVQVSSASAAWFKQNPRHAVLAMMRSCGVLFEAFLQHPLGSIQVTTTVAAKNAKGQPWNSAPDTHLLRQDFSQPLLQQDVLLQSDASDMFG